jgi:hypothetical protein
MNPNRNLFRPLFSPSSLYYTSVAKWHFFSFVTWRNQRPRPFPLMPFSRHSHFHKWISDFYILDPPSDPPYQSILTPPNLNYDPLLDPPNDPNWPLFGPPPNTLYTPPKDQKSRFSERMTNFGCPGVYRLFLSKNRVLGVNIRFCVFSRFWGYWRGEYNRGYRLISIEVIGGRYNRL